MDGLDRFAAKRRGLCVSLLGMFAGARSFAQPVDDSLARPALSVRAPGRTVLLGGAVVGDRIVAVGERGMIALSDDEGRTWRQAPSPVSVTLTAVRFADERNGMAVGHGGTVLVTSDAGEHWQVRLDGRKVAQLAFDSASKLDDPRAKKEAERLVSEGPDKPFLDLVLINPQRAIVVGAYGLAFETQDGGATWKSWMARFDNPKSLHLYAIRRDGNDFLVAGEQGLVFRSADGGASFRRLATPYGGSFFTAEFVRDGSLVLAGLRGNVWRSERGASAWTQILVPAPASITASAVRPDGTLVLATQAGFVLAMRDERLVPINSSPLPPVNGLVVGKNLTLALTVQGAIPVSASPAQDASK